MTTPPGKKTRTISRSVWKEEIPGTEGRNPERLEALKVRKAGLWLGIWKNGVWKEWSGWTRGQCLWNTVQEYSLDYVRKEREANPYSLPEAIQKKKSNTGNYV